MENKDLERRVVDFLILRRTPEGAQIPSTTEEITQGIGISTEETLSGLGKAIQDGLAFQDRRDQKWHATGVYLNSWRCYLCGKSHYPHVECNPSDL